MGDAFPLQTVPGRIRTAILHEFQGRCPTMQEVAQLSNKQWLAVPGIGPSALETLRSVTFDPQPTAEASPSASISDGELLDRLTSIQEELRCIRHVLRAKMEPVSSSGTRVLRRSRMRYHPDATRELRV